ncbi:hypothetical protein NDU88_002007 [Pleurodeles waltl]|uniref:Uncharacterized protein n=1 Tax=Pleurodeles waltl TaxID=8319 RepID=A0AAV7LZ92_PLEWA|nr:hypothetical protein NDU88_002007 [Pleurodeles waltl]
MGLHKWTDASQGNTMEQYTTPVPLPQRTARSEVSGDDMRVPLNPKKPSRAELLAAIQGSRVALEGKKETAAVEVNLLWAELRKGEITLFRSTRGGVTMVGDVPGRTEGPGGVTHWASGAESPDWRSRDAGWLVDHRVEIQQEGTMTEVATDLVGETALERELGGGGALAVV